MRRILIVTGGLSPAVVTETVWALANQRKPAFWPERVIAVVTASVVPRYRDALGGSYGKIAELATDLGMTVVPRLEIEQTECEDIRSDADAIAFGDKVCEVVQRETEEPDQIVHLSLAGGRKTMSFHGGAAMTLFGRTQDELSHVLVSPQALEGCPEFWWPTRNERWISHRDQRDKTGQPREYNSQAGLGADRAHVDLALIPFVRVRNSLPPALRERPMKYAQYVAQANAAIEGGADIVLELVPDSCELIVAGVEQSIKLEPQEFAVYRLLVEWAQQSVPGCGPEGVGSNQVGFLSTAMIRTPQKFLPNPMVRLRSLGGRGYVTNTGKDSKGANSAFGENIARLKRKLEYAIANTELRDRLLCTPRGRYGVGLLPREISIRSLATASAKGEPSS